VGDGDFLDVGCLGIPQRAFRDSGLEVRLGLALLAITIVGILSPLVLFPSTLFAGKDHAPTLEGH